MENRVAIYPIYLCFFLNNVKCNDISMYKANRKKLLFLVKTIYIKKKKNKSIFYRFIFITYNLDNTKHNAPWHIT